METVGEHGAVLAFASVVLASSDISAGAAEVNLQTVRSFLLASGAGESREIGADLAGSVIAHGVGGIATKGGDGPFAVPKGNGFQPRINRAHGCIGGEDVATTGTSSAKGDFAIRQNITTVGGDLLDLGLS